MKSRLGWDRLSDRDRRAVTLGLALVLPALVWVAGVRPYRAAVGDVRDQAAAERALLERELELLQSEAEIRHDLRKARGRTAEAERRLMSAANTALAEAELIDYLETVAALSRVLLEEIRTVPPGRDEVAPEGLQPVRLAVRGESDLEGVLTFLETVETNPLLLRVAGLTIEPVLERPDRDDDDGPPARARPTGVVELGVVVEAYARPPEASASGRQSVGSGSPTETGTPPEAGRTAEGAGGTESAVGATTGSTQRR